MNRLTWKIGGEAGFGIMVSGQTFSKVLSRAGYHTIETNDYPSLIRGGHNAVTVTFSGAPIGAQWRPVDLLVALNRQTIDLHIAELSCGGIIIYDEDIKPEKKYPAGIHLLSVPFIKIARDVGSGMLMRNTVALGASMALLGLDINYLKDMLISQFQRKGEEIVAQNVNAAQKGHQFIKDNYKEKINIPQPDPKPIKKVVVTGAEAVALGAISADLKFFAAYPMTPINGILTYIASVAQKAGVIYKQPEDEIAGINMAIGASVAGVRSMVATSGGGYSLMVEGTSLAGMIETPVVIVMGMRPGPATGLPTWTAQADLHFILNASQGEFPRLVLAPGDATEAFYLTMEAFNLADIYQTPTFILVDKNLCETRFSTPFFDTSKIKIDRGKLLPADIQNQTPELARYKLTDDGISPRGILGRKGGVFRANSDEHNEMGYSDEEAQNAYHMISKRMKKLEVAERNVPDPVVFGDKDSDITLVGWGSTKGAALEAIKELKTKDQRLKANYLHLNYINPFPSKFVKDFLSKAKRVIDVEGNHNAQMAQYIHIKTGIKIKDQILKFDGRQFYPEDIIDGIKKFL